MLGVVPLRCPLQGFKENGLKNIGLSNIGKTKHPPYIPEGFV